MADETEADEDVFDVEEEDLAEDPYAEEPTETVQGPPRKPVPPPAPGQQIYGSQPPPQPAFDQPPPPEAYAQQTPMAYTQQSPQPQIYIPPTSYNTSSRPRFVHKYVETEGLNYDEDDKSMVSAGISLPRTSVNGSLIHLHPIRNGFLVKFYQIAGLQGRISYFLMSMYVINAPVYDSWFGGIVLYPYLFANMVYGYTFIIFTRVHFLTMPILPKLLWSFLGSMMFSFASCVTFQWVADNWGGKSPYPRVLVATILSVLYGRMYAGALLSYFNYVDKKILSLVRRVYGPYILDI